MSHPHGTESIAETAIWVAFIHTNPLSKWEINKIKLEDKSQKSYIS